MDFFDDKPTTAPKRVAVQTPASSTAAIATTTDTRVSISPQNQETPPLPLPQVPLSNGSQIENVDVHHTGGVTLPPTIGQSIDKPQPSSVANTDLSTRPISQLSSTPVNTSHEPSNKKDSTSSPVALLKNFGKSVMQALSPSSRSDQSIVEQNLVQTKDSAEVRTTLINNDVDAYKKYGTFACSSTTLYHMMDRWLTQVHDNFFAQSHRFQTVYQHKYLQGELEVRSLSEFEHIGNSKLRFIELCEQWEQDFKNTFVSLERCSGAATLQEERRKVIEAAIELSTNIFGELKMLSSCDRRYSMDTDEVEAFLSELQARNSKTTFSIPVVGLEKAGKSSTLNAVLGYDLLPSALEQCTLVVTQIRSSENSKFLSKVFFRTEDELDEFLGDPNLDLSSQDVSAIKSECRPFFGKVESETADTAAELKRGIELNVKEKKKQYIVKYVEIAVPNLKIGGNNVIFIDTPGSNAKIRAHEKITAQVLDQADACLYVKRGSQPTDTKEGALLSDRLQSKEGAFSPVISSNNNDENRIPQPDPEFHTLSKSKVFVVLTHLDMRASSRINEAIQLCRRELAKKGFNDDNIIPADPRYSLFAQKQNQLTNDEKNELAEYTNSSTFKSSGLASGIDTIKKKLTHFIEVDLPLVRIRDAKACVTQAYAAMQNIRSLLTKDIPSSGSFRTQVDRQKEELIQKAWNEKMKNCTNSANEWLFFNILNKKQQLIEEWSKLFYSLFVETFHAADAHSRDLKLEIPKMKASLGNINLDPIEEEERLRLVAFHMSGLHFAIEQMADCLWRLLVQFSGSLSTTLGDGLDFGWRIHDCLNFDVCLHEIKCLVMRVIYPLIYACLRWPIRHDQRKFAVEELYTAAPELFYGQESEPGVLKIPVGVEGVMNVATSLGFLP